MSVLCNCQEKVLCKLSCTGICCTLFIGLRSVVPLMKQEAKLSLG